MEHIPPDLITQILPLVPAKTLLRFRCVSKSLCNIIDSPDFINLHLLHARTHHPKIIFLEHFLLCHINPVPIHTFNINGPFPPELPPKFPRGLDHRVVDDGMSTALIAHCNGLVLLMEFPFSLVVWNPSTQKCWNLPIIPTTVSDDRRIVGRCLGYKSKYGEWETQIVGWGFGYDSSINDYKVLIIIKQTHRVIWPDDGEIEIRDEEYEIWILSFRSGYWRMIEQISRCEFIGRYAFDLFTITNNTDDFRNCFVDGAFHFCNNDAYIFKHGVVMDNLVVISSFDVVKETFSRVEVSPPDFILVNGTVSSLQVVEGCLCVSFFSPENNLDLYARKKNDVGEFFWTKLISISYQHLSCYLYNSELYKLWRGEILGFSKEEGKIYVLCHKYAVYSYDFNEKTIERIGAVNGANQMALSCIESLVRTELLCNKSSVQEEVRVKKNQRNKKKPILQITSRQMY